jgi:surface-anchored protein
MTAISAPFRRCFVVAAITLGLLAVSHAAESPVRANQERVVISSGHVDVLAPRVVDGTVRVQMRDDTVSPAVWRDPSDVVLHVPDAARLTLPDDAAFRFLGAPGDSVWLLPQVQQQGLVWPGWNTQDPSLLALGNASMTLTLGAVEGPGRFVLFLTGSFGEPSVLLSTDRPLPQPMNLELNTHAHANWAFSAPGVYRLSVEMAVGGSRGTAVLTFAVGDIDPGSAFAVPAPTGSVAPEGDSASQQPESQTSDGVELLPIVGLLVAGGLIAVGTPLVVGWLRQHGSSGGQ